MYGSTQIEVVVLPEGSFFGETSVLLGIRSYFGMKTVAKDKGDKYMLNGVEHTQIYELESSVFKELVQDYPDFANQIYMRGELRNAYFKHLALLRQGEFGYQMKVIEQENRMLSEKTRGLTDGQGPFGLATQVSFGSDRQLK